MVATSNGGFETEERDPWPTRVWNWGKDRWPLLVMASSTLLLAVPEIFGKRGQVFGISETFFFVAAAVALITGSLANEQKQRRASELAREAQILRATNKRHRKAVHDFCLLNLALMARRSNTC